MIGGLVNNVSSAVNDFLGTSPIPSRIIGPLTEGKTLDEAQQIKNAEIAEELALPPVKIHCSVLAEDAIKAAVEDYRRKQP